jgi:hypothetical protein
MSTSGHTFNGKRREWFRDGGLGVPGDPGGEGASSIDLVSPMEQ